MHMLFFLLAFWSCHGYPVHIIKTVAIEYSSDTRHVEKGACEWCSKTWALTFSPSTPASNCNFHLLWRADMVPGCLCCKSLGISCKACNMLEASSFLHLFAKKRVYYLAFFHGDLIQGLWTKWKWKWKTPFSYKMPLTRTLNVDSLNRNKYHKNQEKAPKKFIVVNCKHH